jgi:NAD(P)-dependent dehydrogenase (short-subunit alcohol dehydrogenase family)
VTSRLVVVSGSASGIGAAVRRRQEARGDRVIGVDVRDAEIKADLGTPAGRAEAVAAIGEAAGGTVDAAILCAGVRGRGEGVVSVNYFGTVALLLGLRPLLQQAESPSAVAVASHAMIRGALAAPIVSACLNGDEAEARRLVPLHDEAYAAGKLALAMWIRSEGPGDNWAGAGITLNAVSPGIVATPMVAPFLEDPIAAAHLREVVPAPLGRDAQPEDIAGVLEFLTSPGARMICGQVIFADGGAEALMQPHFFERAYPGDIPGASLP